MEGPMPDQPVDLSPKVLPPGERTEFTPEERAAFWEWSEGMDRKLIKLHARADRTLILMGLTP